HVLTKRAVSPIAMTRLPELIPVSLIPVTVWRRAIRRLKLRCLGDPLRGNQLASVPHALLQVELTQTCDFLCAHAEPDSTECDAVQTRHPRWILEAQRIEQARSQIIEHRHAGRFLNDRRKHVCRGGVVEKMRARLERNRMREKHLRQPLATRHLHRGGLPPLSFSLMSRRHP